MTSGGNNFNYFPENQLIKFKLCPPPPTSLFLPFPRRISETHFASPWVPLDAAVPQRAIDFSFRSHQLNTSDRSALSANVLSTVLFVSTNYMPPPAPVGPQICHAPLGSLTMKDHRPARSIAAYSNKTFLQEFSSERPGFRKLNNKHCNKPDT